MISVNFRDSRPIYVQIKENVIRQIMSGSLRQDDKLPSVRELAVELAINPNTIQRAYRELESEGYIYVAAGKGTFISPKGEMKADTKKLMETFRE
nr:GntR family transcriptional regulator [Clostridiales bacterium]